MSYTFTSQEQEALRAAYAQCPQELNGTGNYVPLYEKLSEIIGSHLSNNSLDPDTLQDLKNAKLWLDVAVGANGGSGMHSAFIRTFTNRQGELRLGHSFTQEEMQMASNGVARNLWINLTSNVDSTQNWVVPKIHEIASADASAIGEILFDPELPESDTSVFVNSAWSGALGFNALGGDSPWESWRLITAGDPGSEIYGSHNLATFNRLDDFKNILFAVDAYDKALKAGFQEAGISFANYLVLTIQTRGVGVVYRPEDLLAQANIMIESGRILPFISTLAEGSPVAPYVELFSNLGVTASLDMLRRSIFGNDITSSNESTFAINAKDFFAATGDGQKLGIEKISDTTAVASQSNSDFSSFVALHSLSLFRFTGQEAIDGLKQYRIELYNQWQHDVLLSQEDAVDGKENFSTRYRDDRAQMLGWMLKQSETGEIGGFSQTDGLYGYDYKQLDWQGGEDDFTIIVQSKNSPSLSPRVQVIFGSETSDVINGGEVGIGDRLYGRSGNDTINGKGGDDYLEGNDGADTLSGGQGNDYIVGGSDNDTINGDIGNDSLFGGEGSDTLDGGKGNDTLKGGTGADTYIFNDGGGVDSIIDDGNDGKIYWKLDEANQGDLLSGGKQIAPGIQAWLSEDEKYSYVVMDESDGSQSLVIAKIINGATTSDRIVIRKYTPGKLGINLQDATAPEPIPAPSNVIILESTSDGKGDVHHVQSMTPYVVIGTEYEDEIEGGGGDDYIHGGLGDDYLDGNSGNDVIEGQGGNDQLSGGYGDDEIYGDVKLSIEDAIAAANATQSSDSVELLQGSYGDDIIVGGTTTGWLLGGANKDIIIGGGDNDYIGGDTFYDGRGMEAEEVITHVVFDDSKHKWSFYFSIVEDGQENYYGSIGQVDVDGDDDIIYSGGGEDTVLGHLGDDYLSLGRSSDIGIGGEGSDTLFGGDGDDHIFGDFNHDASAPSGNETQAQLAWYSGIHGAYHGNDTLFGDKGSDSIEGNGGDDTLFGGEDNDYIDGDDRITPGDYHGMDYLDGGDGNDEMWGGGENDVLLGGSGDDRLQGDYRPNILEGQFHGKDILDGGIGNDILEGGGNDDTLSGGEGNDELWGDTGVAELQGNYHGKDQLDGGAGADNIIGGANDDFILGGNGNDFIDGDDDESRVAAGFHGNDVIYGGQGEDLIYGRAGNDLIFGEEDDDELQGGEGHDQLNGGTGSDFLLGDGGDDILHGEDGNDRLQGGSGNDQINGGTGDDILFGEEGNDLLDGGEGADYLDGGAGKDTYRNVGKEDTIIDADGKADIVFSADVNLNEINATTIITNGVKKIVLDINGKKLLETDHLGASTDQKFTLASGESFTQSQLLGERLFETDTPSFTEGDDVINGYAADDNIDGGFGNDQLFGHAGDDTLKGYYGEDILSGGKGNDYLSGGIDSDIYLFSRGDGHDIIDDGGDESNHNILRFGIGIQLDDVTALRLANGDLLLKISDDGGQITVKNWYNEPNARLSKIEFADGTFISAEELDDLPVPSIEGTQQDDYLEGSDYNDTIIALNGNDTIDGNGGNDHLDGGDGMDTYILSHGMGQDTVIDHSIEGSLLKLGPGIGLADIDAHRNGNDLFVHIAATSDGVMLKDYFLGNTNWSLQNNDNTIIDVEAVIESTKLAEQDIVSKLAQDFIVRENYKLVSELLSEGYIRQNDGSFYKKWNADISGTYSRTTTTSTTSYNFFDGNVVTHTTSDTEGKLFLGYGGLLEKKFIIGDVVIRNINDSDSSEPIVNWQNTSQTVMLDMEWKKVLWQPERRTTTQTSGWINGEYNGVVGHFTATTTVSKKDASVQGKIQGIEFTSVPPESTNNLPNQVQSTLYSETIVRNEVLYHGSDSDDSIIGNGFINGGDGNDYLSGGNSGEFWEEDDAVLIGGEGDDTLSWGGILFGGAGNDSMSGGRGATRFIIDPSHFGTDLIVDNFGGVDSIEFASGVTPSDIQVEWGIYDPLYSNRQMIKLSWGENKEVYFDFYNADVDGDYVDVGIELVKFHDGTTWTIEDVVSKVTNLPTSDDDTLIGTAGEEIIYGMDGSDIILGRAGNDVLDGGSGNDYLIGDSGTDLLIGASGNDYITAENASFLIGGSGNDSINAFSGSIFAFNSGDGADILNHDLFTLSLGGGIQAADLYFAVDGDDLILHMGSTDSIRFSGLWSYFYQDEYPLRTLQIIGTDIRTYNLDAVLAEFQAAVLAGASSSGWSLSDSLAAHTLSISTNQAIGGDLAYRYARNGNLDGLSAEQIQAVLADYNFGTVAQAVQPDFISSAADDYLLGTNSSEAITDGVGNDILQGGNGNDTISDAEGANLLDGGAGDDSIEGGAGIELLIGGNGIDVIQSSEGADILAFNRGHGQDTVLAGFGQEDTLSLGKEITYADLVFSKEASDLVLNTGNGDQIVFDDWYAALSNQSVATLQMVIEGNADYDAASTDSLYNSKVMQFDFAGLVSAFDQATAADPSLTNWSLSSSMLQFLLNSSDTEAIGGDLAYQYAKNGNLSNVSLTPAQAILGNAGFGAVSQALQQESALQDLSPRLL